MRNHDAHRKTESLTARERDVIALLAEGLSNRQISERLFMSERTVRHHLGSMFQKLGVKNRFELLVWALRRGLIRVTE